MRTRSVFRIVTLSLLLAWHGQLLAGHLDHALTGAPAGAECPACAFGGTAGAAVPQADVTPPVYPFAQTTPETRAVSIRFLSRRTPPARAPPF